jgi:hypothetical protein
LQANQKNSESSPSTQFFAATMTQRGPKSDEISIDISVQGTGGVPEGLDPENRVGDQDIGSPGKTVTSRLQVPHEPGHFQEEDHTF